MPVRGTYTLILMLVSVNAVKKEPDTIHRKLQKNTETKKFVLFSLGKIVFGVVDVNPNDLFKQASLNNTRGHMCKLYKQRHHTNVGASFFCESSN